jgi:hypothetical protein
VYNLRYTATLWGYKVEEKLHLKVRQQKMVEYHCCSGTEEKYSGDTFEYPTGLRKPEVS